MTRGAGSTLSRPSGRRKSRAPARGSPLASKALFAAAQSRKMFARAQASSISGGQTPTATSPM